MCMQCGPSSLVSRSPSLVPRPSSLSLPERGLSSEHRPARGRAGWGLGVSQNGMMGIPWPELSKLAFLAQCWRSLAQSGVVFGVRKFHCGMERISSANRWPPWPLLYLGLAAPAAHIPPSLQTSPPLPHLPNSSDLDVCKFHALAQGQLEAIFCAAVRMPARADTLHSR